MEFINQYWGQLMFLGGLIYHIGYTVNTIRGLKEDTAALKSLVDKNKLDAETKIRAAEDKQQDKIDKMIEEWRDMRADFSTMRTDISWIKRALQQPNNI